MVGELMAVCVGLSVRTHMIWGHFKDWERI
jgi:hypothetical protein